MNEDQISFYDGIAISRDRFVCLSSFDALDHPNEPSQVTRIVSFDYQHKTWNNIATRDWYGQRITRFKETADTASVAAIISNRGHILIEGDPLIEEEINDLRTQGMYGLKQIGERLYAVGAAGFFFHRVRHGEWTLFTDQKFDPEFHKLTSSQQFEAVSGGRNSSELTIEEEVHFTHLAIAPLLPVYTIDGTGPNDLYIGGHNGTLNYFDGIDLHEIKTDTFNSLVDMAISPDGDIYILGSNKESLILKGSHQKGFVEFHKSSRKTVAIYRMAFLHNRVYLADPQEKTGGLYYLQDGELFQLGTTFDPPIGPVWHVDVQEDVLWAMAEKELLRFDGKNWERFIHPDA